MFYNKCNNNITTKISFDYKHFSLLNLAYFCCTIKEMLKCDIKVWDKAQNISEISLVVDKVQNKEELALLPNELTNITFLVKYR